MSLLTRYTQELNKYASLKFAVLLLKYIYIYIETVRGIETRENKFRFEQTNDRIPNNSKAIAIKVSNKLERNKF